jgi:uncharacterized membrane protein
LPPPGNRPRRRYIDWARGVAVLVMIEAHTIDAWTRAADRESIAFRNARIVGGFAAPLFLWLAGIAAVLAAAATLRRTGSRAAAVEAVCRRGLEIFILAFLFRIQAFIVSPGSDLLMIFRVDILNIMGPALVAAGLLWSANRTTSGMVWSCAAVAVLIAMITPLVRATTVLDPLPQWIQWYLRPAGQQTTFVAFPWAGFVFAGAGVGALIAEADDARRERRVQIGVGAVGAALVALGFYMAARPSIYGQSSSFWTSSPTYFAMRVGIVMTILPISFAIDRLSHESTKARKNNSVFRVFALWWQKPLETIGRSSLFVYWIHVELVYGYATWPIHNRLPLSAVFAAWGTFCGLMYAAVLAKDRVRQWRPALTGPGRTSGEKGSYPFFVRLR